MSQIGIKLANHDFFPIIDDSQTLPVSKELELTTAKDGQATVQINLFRKYKSEDLVFIGSLVLEDLKASASGDATIALRLSLDERRHLEAEAIDMDGVAKQSFSIDVDRLNEGNFLANDFDIEDPFQNNNEEQTFSSSLSEIDDIDLSFTDMEQKIDENEGGGGGEELHSSDEDDFGSIDLADFDGSVDNTKDDSNEQDNEFSANEFSTVDFANEESVPDASSIDEFSSDTFETTDFGNTADIEESSNNDFSMDNFPTDSFASELDVSNDEIDNSINAETYNTITDNEGENDTENWSSLSDEDDKYDGTATYYESYEDEEKTGFPMWLKIFVILLIICLLALVGILIFKNLKSGSQTDGQDIAIVDLEEDIKEGDEETDSIDSLTTQAPKKEKEPFKSPELDETLVQKTTQETVNQEETKEQPKTEDVKLQEKTQEELANESTVASNDAQQPNITENKKDEKVETAQIKKSEVKKVGGSAIKKTVRYKIREGDTLWDLSETFYKTPWKYKKIARHNRIRNPNKIIANTFIDIPAK